MTFVAAFADGPGTVELWYHTNRTTAVPAINPDNPEATGWTNSPSGLLINHLAFVVGTMPALDGPYTIQITTLLADPVTFVPLPDGVIFTNHVSIATDGTERTLTNNFASAVTRTPGVDMALTKTGSSEGSLPGSTPGVPLTYTLTYENSGTVRAYGVAITDTLPAEVTPGIPLDNFNEITLVDDLGDPVFAVDTNGASILASIPITRTIDGSVITWYLGSTNAADSTYYRNIGLPSGAIGSFQLYTTIRSDLPDSTVIINPASVSITNQVGNNIPEAYTNNNWDSSMVVVYLADLAIEKTVEDVTTGDENWTEAVRELLYTVTYNNLGNRDALDTVITEYIPVGTRFVPNSITGLPVGATVDYTTANDTNCTRFEVDLGTLPAPATYDSESTTNDFTGTTDETVVTTNGAVQLNTVAASSGTNFNILIDFGSSVYMTTGGVSVAPNGGFGWNNFTNPVAGSVLSNLVTYTPGFAGVTTTVAIILNTAATIDTNGLGGTGAGRFRPRATIDSFSGTGSGSITMTFTNLDPNLNYMFEVWGSRQSLPSGGNGETAYVVSGALGSAYTRCNVFSNNAPVTRGVISAMKPFNNGTLTLTLSKTTNNTIDFYCLSALEIIACAAPLQFHENFDYPEVANTAHSTNIAWRVDGSSAVGGTNLTGSLSYTGLAASVGNRLDLNPTILANPNSRMWREFNYKFDYNNPLYGSNSPYYCSFLFKVTDIGTLAYTNNRGFVWMEGGGANDGFLIRLNTNNPANYDVGIASICQGTAAPTAPVWNTNGGNGYAPGQTMLIVMGMTNASQSLLFDLWINPSASTFGLAAPAPDLSTTNRRTIIKGDSIAIGSGNGARIELDELRIGSSYADVTPLAGSNPTNGTYTTYIQSSGALLTWDRLLVGEEEPVGTVLTFTLLDQTGTNILIGPVNPTGFIDISSIPPANTQLTLRVTFDAEASGDSPILDFWTVTYRTADQPSFTFRVTVDNPLAAGRTVISNFIDIATTTPETTYTNNQDNVIIQVNATDLVIQKSVDPAATLEDSNIVYTLTYRNNGPMAATNVVLRDFFPTNELIYVGSNPSATPQQITNVQVIGINFGTNAVIANWNSMDNLVRTNDNLVATNGINTGIRAAWNGTLAVTALAPVSSTVPPGIPGQVFSNYMRETASRTLTFSNLNTSAEYRFWLIGLRNVAFTNSLAVRGATTNGLEQIDGANRVRINEFAGTNTTAFFDYTPLAMSPRTDGTIDVFFSNSVAAAGLVVTEVLVVADPTVLTWTFPSLAPGDEGTITITGTVRVGTADSTINNCADIANDRQETDYGNNSACAVTYVGSLANLYLTKTGPGLIDFGTTNTFTLSYGNNGNGIAPDSVVQDTLPADLIFVSATPDTNASPALSWSLGTLNPGDTGVITIAFTVTNVAAVNQWLTNRASIATSTNEVTLADNQDTHPVYPQLQPARIAGMVWYDYNLDGTNDLAESGISGVTITLIGLDVFGNSVTQTTVTAANGTYSFPGLNPGTYAIQETQPANYFSTAAVPGTGASGSTGSVATLNSFTNITLLAGDDAIDYDFGEAILATLGDRVWRDPNLDGIQDPGETGVPGVTVVLYHLTEAFTNAISTNITDASGFYLFTNLMPGVTNRYVVEFTRPDGYWWTTPTNTATTIDLDSDAIYAGANTDANAASLPVTLLPGQNNLALDAGLYPLSSLGDRVWFDFNGNGLQDFGENTAITNVPVYLYDANTNLLDSTTTDSAGLYLFADLVPGTYLVGFDLTTVTSTGNVRVTTANAGADDRIDSDGEFGDTGEIVYTAPFALSVGETNLMKDLGLTFIILKTRAEVAEVTGAWIDESARLTWETSSEWNTAGFFVYRIHPLTGEETRLTEKLIPSALRETGSIYACTDPAASEGQTAHYRLVEIELSGDVLDLGLHEVTFRRETTEASVKRTAKASPPPAPRPLSEPVREGTSPVAKCLVRTHGLQSVLLPDLAAVMGREVADLRALVAATNLAITDQEQPVAYLYDAVRDRLLFHGQASTNWYTRDRAYLIRESGGLAMTRRDPGAASGSSTFRVTAHFEEDRYPFDSLTYRPDDFYYWTYIISGSATDGERSFALDLTGYLGGPVALRVYLQGWSSTSSHRDHRAAVTLNGVPLGVSFFDASSFLLSMHL